MRRCELRSMAFVWISYGFRMALVRRFVRLSYGVRTAFVRRLSGVRKAFQKLGGKYSENRL